MPEKETICQFVLASVYALNSYAKKLTHLVSTCGSEKIVFDRSIGVAQQVRNRQISVMPAYDDSHFRTNNQTYEVLYKEGMYNTQWKKALDEVKAGNVDVIAIATWNEWHERTAIEPHYRNGTNASPFYAYGLTKNYIRELRSIDQIDAIISMLTYIKNLAYVLIATTSILVVAMIYIIRRKHKAREVDVTY